MSQNKPALFSTRNICISGIIAALYAVLTLVLAPISYGAIQCRVSEAMTLLPMVLPQSIPGLIIGCLVSNIIGSGSIWDIIFGTLATAIAAFGTYFFRKNKIAAAAFPVLANGIIVGLVLSLVYSLPIMITMAEVAAGELIAVLLGFPLIAALKKTQLKDDFIR